MIEELFLLLGLVAGAGAMLAVARARRDAERRAFEEQRAALAADRQRLSDAFEALSAKALQQNNAAFLQLAQQALETQRAAAVGDLGQKQEAIAGIVKPLADSLAKYDVQLQQLEQKRAQAYGSLEANLKTLGQMQAALQKETGTLASALRNPQVRGRWGELALQRAVELAGMTEHCDFHVQATGDDGLRPDLVVHLPGSRSVVVDAKAPLAGYLEAVAATTDEARKAALERYVKQVRNHLRALGDKAYWQQFEPAPEFVVMFLPGEAFFSAALENDPGLLEEAAEHRVILATGTTLIALLLGVAQGWRQEKVAKNAEQVSALGRELHDRLLTMGKHVAALGCNLGRSVEAYNKFVGSYESRVLTSARRFQDYGAASGEELPEAEPLTVAPRSVQAALAEES